MSDTIVLAKPDAKNRAMRTLVQGLLLDVMLASAGTAYVVLTGDKFGWVMLATAVGKTALTTVVSYVMRLKMGNVLLRDSSTPAEPVVVQIGDYSLELQRPNIADHAAA